jgi:hypothetical protein
MDRFGFEEWLSGLKGLTAAQRGRVFRKLALAEAAESGDDPLEASTLRRGRRRSSRTGAKELLRAGPEDHRVRAREMTRVRETTCSRRLGGGASRGPVACIAVRTG